MRRSAVRMFLCRVLRVRGQLELCRQPEIGPVANPRGVVHDKAAGRLQLALIRIEEYGEIQQLVLQLEETRELRLRLRGAVRVQRAERLMPTEPRQRSHRPK